MDFLHHIWYFIDFSDLSLSLQLNEMKIDISSSSTATNIAFMRRQKNSIPEKYFWSFAI